MKLKKTIKPAAPVADPAESEGPAIADRFKLDVEATAPVAATTGKKATLLALVGSLLALGALGAVTFMLYTNWELIKDA